jgi:multiple sugar transport system permease protein
VLTRRRRQALPYLMIAPVVGYLAVVLGLPILEGIASTFMNRQLLGAEPHWVGDLNYQRLLRDARFWSALTTTFVYTLAVVAAVMSTALGTALILHRRFRFRWLARGMMILPWAFPEVSAVLVWGFMFSQAYGVLNLFVRAILPIPENLAWLANPNLAFTSIVVMTTWKIFPFYSLVLLAALQTVDLHLYEAARIDGAGTLDSFRYITLPGIAPTLGILTLLVTIWSFRRFTIIYLMTGGGPATATETIVIRVYIEAFKFINLSYAATIATAGLVVSLAITAVYFVARRRLGMA